ncbi:hypothetical protein [Pontibacter ruber]|uniref:Uncharacterized protein n=1 Tax=Pontibacter ruber TaxID=1343895 RepID=A0ABW5CVX7_9BACT|nr:hypothetical protein [Pontibacter ruber]
MKKLLLFITVSLFVIISSASAASLSNISIEIEKKCTESTRALANKLLLNEAEYIQLKKLNRERMLKLDEIAQTFSNDVISREAKTEEVEKAFTKRIRKFLTPTQMQAYFKYKQTANVRYIVAITE